eukprot:224080-Pleurochrysis_carterae.AAC.1
MCTSNKTVCSSQVDTCYHTRVHISWIRHLAAARTCRRKQNINLKSSRSAEAHQACELRPARSGTDNYKALDKALESQTNKEYRACARHVYDDAKVIYARGQHDGQKS